jgi:ATP-dependent exoDNAse (exonuclease V) beta subunit
LSDYDSTRLPSGDYSLKIAYRSREELDEIINELLSDISSEADMRHCYIEAEAWENGTDYRW